METKTICFRGGERNGLVEDLLEVAYPVDANRAAQIDAVDEHFERITLPDAASFRWSRGNQYCPILWLPQAIGMRIGFLLTSNPYQVWQCARVFSLITYSFFISCSIVLLPRLKIVAAYIFSFPPVVFCASSLMCDGTLVGICALLVSICICSNYTDNQVSRFALAVILIGICYMVLVKVAYLPVIAGFYFLPNKNFSFKKKIATTTVIIGSVFLYLLWSRTYSGCLYMANALSNVSAILSDPIGFMALVAHNCLIAIKTVFVEQRMRYSLFALSVLLLPVFVCLIEALLIKMKR